MEIKQIIYFLALCEDLHFTRAARRCGVAQPSLTNAIRALEEEFGAPLFHRKPKPHLSELGMAVKPHLERAFADIESALARSRRAPPHNFGRRQGARFHRVMNGDGDAGAANKKISLSN
jgi:DNA-binding transcriptional LysR family regulator